jgi:hypothetical protein
MTETTEETETTTIEHVTLDTDLGVWTARHVVDHTITQLVRAADSIGYRIYRIGHVTPRPDARIVSFTLYLEGGDGRYVLGLTRPNTEGWLGFWNAAIKETAISAEGDLTESEDVEFVLTGGADLTALLGDALSAIEASADNTDIDALSAGLDVEAGLAEVYRRAGVAPTA